MRLHINSNQEIEVACQYANSSMSRKAQLFFEYTSLENIICDEMSEGKITDDTNFMLTGSYITALHDKQPL
jgi:hypothetical protein